ncbi:MAG: HAD-IIB family hydrolase [Vibrio sp.]
MLEIDQNTLIFTDLDGTLLDHDNYQFDAILPVLSQLKSRHVDVIPTTSKTFAELQFLMQQLHLTTPFIVENGAAAFLPKHHFVDKPKQTDSFKGYWRHSFTPVREQWGFDLQEAKHKFNGLFRLFTSMSADEVANLTGLSKDEASRALLRQYGEPVQWLGSDKQAQEFIEFMTQQGACVLQGGRFLHITGDTNKGDAMAWVVAQYQSLKPDAVIKTIALGDSGNDVAMLERADLAIRIRSPNHEFPVLDRTQGVIDSQAYGPEGWHACISQLLKDA